MLQYFTSMQRYSVPSDVFYWEGNQGCNGHMEDCACGLGSSFHSFERWFYWGMMTKEGDISLAKLADKFPDPIVDLGILWEHCRLKDPDELPEADLAMQVDNVSKNMTPKKGKKQKVKSARHLNQSSL
ncbi:hypothetical protein R1sor_019801 [Riccia sorocarpa]|uniref:Uncharacterized protein n=1 Tax=Riccia sorocarpa TaxID=122646 RepID=A0ABD3IJS2_9MARC